ncbi:unnamed protein product [Coccothraustes coccothraustes]
MNNKNMRASLPPSIYCDRTMVLKREPGGCNMSGGLVLSGSGNGREASQSFGKDVFASGCSGRRIRSRCLCRRSAVTTLTDKSRTAPAPSSSRARAGADRAAPPVPRLGERGPESSRLRCRFRECRPISGCERAAPAGARPRLHALPLSERLATVRFPLGHLEWFGPRPGPASERPRPPFCAAAGRVRRRWC